MVRSWSPNFLHLAENCGLESFFNDVETKKLDCTLKFDFVNFNEIFNIPCKMVYYWCIKFWYETIYTTVWCYMEGNFIVIPQYIDFRHWLILALCWNFLPLPPTLKWLFFLRNLASHNLDFWPDAQQSTIKFWNLHKILHDIVYSNLLTSKT